MGNGMMSMKIIDFDARFFEFARKWVAAHPGLTEDQVESSYNSMMEEWINTPADWLDGARPATYFDRYTDASELIELMQGYFDKKVNLPEPLYARIVALGDACAPLLRAIVADVDRSEDLRAEALGMLRDIGDRDADELLIAMVTGAQAQDELSDLAADVLSYRDEATARRLLDAYPGAPEHAQMLILDVCCNFPGDARICDYLLQRLRNQPEQRALNASLLAKLGDQRAMEPLKEMLNLYDLRYLDYIELRDAVEALGGDAGEDRSFYGDPDFEALRKL